MSAALVIACEENYWPGAEKLIRSFDDNTGYKFDIVIISRTITKAPGLIIRPQTPAGVTGMPWLADSFTWFEALKLHHGTLIIMDADQLVTGDIDKLFDLDTGIHLAPANNDKYCTGLVVIEGGTQDERMDLYEELCEMVDNQTWYYGDQSLLNKYIIDNDININQLPIDYQWLKAYGDPTPSAKVVHYHGHPKPWDGRDDKYSKIYDLWAQAQK